MLKLFAVVMLLTPGMERPVVERVPVDSYQACLERGAQIKERAEEENKKGSEFRVMVGCEFQSDKSDPS